MFFMNRSLTSLVYLHWGLVAAFVTGSVLCISAVAFATIISGDYETAHSTQVTTTQIAIAKPTVVVGDLMLASIAVHGGSAAVISTVPSGWAQIERTNNDVNIALVSYWKIAGASEPSTYTWVIDGQTTAEGGITAYGGVIGAAPIDVAAGNIGLGTTATTSEITITAANEQIVAIFAVDEGKSNHAGTYFTTSSGMTEKFDTANTPYGPAMAQDEVIQATAGVVGSKSSAISGGNKAKYWAAQQIAFRPAPPTLTFSASPTTVHEGSLSDATSTLTWDSTYADSCTASNGWSGTKSVDGAEVVTPTGTTSITYVLTCNGAGGTVTQSVTLTVVPPPAEIAFDSSGHGANNSGSSISWTHVVNSSDNGILLAALEGTPFAPDSCTYNGVAMTNWGNNVVTSWGPIRVYYLYAPTVGSHTLTCTFSADANGVMGVSASYTGVAQVGFPDADHFAESGGSFVTSISDSVTTNADNAWVVAFGTMDQETGGMTASPGTMRAQDHRTAFTAEIAVSDSNGPKHPAGSVTLGFTGNSSRSGIQLLSLAPAN